MARAGIVSEDGWPPKTEALLSLAGADATVSRGIVTIGFVQRLAESAIRS